ncbi:MAG: class I SAM-dependent methyltransferase, partial [Candidatus Omnitrophota bacterium]|nr:class I SAM-dependent methyltransferase [Candidatus Omnitrophota bacterium]
MVNPQWVDFFYNRQKGWIDGTALFIDTLKKYCNPNSLVLDLGAGSAEGKPEFYSIKGLVKVNIGIDSNKEIYKNEIVDKKILGNVYSLPFCEEAFDLIYADYVLEHIGLTDDFVREISRVLKKGGFFIFRTANEYHYVTLIAKAISKISKSALIHLMRKYGSKNHPSSLYYKMNTAGKLKKLFLKNGFSIDLLQLIEKEPSYLMFNAWLFLLG